MDKGQFDFIFCLNPLPGSKPGDANWEWARYGFKDQISMFNSIFDDNESEKIIENYRECQASTEMNLNSLKCMQPFVHDPEQKKITSFFKAAKEKKNNNETFHPNKPSTSKEFANRMKDEDDELISQQVKKTELLHETKELAKKHMNDDDDLFQYVEDTEMQVVNRKQKIESIELFMDVKKPRTREEISNQRNLAKIKQSDRLDYNRMKIYLEEHFFPIHSWPAFIVALLLSPDFNYHDRLTLATFFHGNGMVDGKRAVRFVQFYNEHSRSKDYRKWKTKLYKFEKLFEFLDKAYNINDPEYHSIRNKYYYYNMIVKHMLYYNGDKRKNGKPQKFVQNPY